MKCKEKLMNVLNTPHLSEKSTIVMEKNNTLIMRVAKNTNKKEIKDAVELLLNVKVHNVRTLIIKGKVKYYNKKIGLRSNYKKAYITLKKGQKLNLLENIVE